MSDTYILDDNNNPVKVPLMDWAQRIGDGSTRVVGKTEAAPGVTVSTVFLGLDHRFGRSGPPILFETMVFGGVNDQDQRRYCTWAEAEAGHAEWVEREKSNLAAAFA